MRCWKGELKTVFENTLRDLTQNLSCCRITWEPAATQRAPTSSFWLRRLWWGPRNIWNEAGGPLYCWSTGRSAPLARRMHHWHQPFHRTPYTRVTMKELKPFEPRCGLLRLADRPYPPFGASRSSLKTHSIPDSNDGQWCEQSREAHSIYLAETIWSVLGTWLNLARV